MTLSRRNMLAFAGASAAIGKAIAQSPPAPPPATPPAEAKPDPVTAAREDNRRSAENADQVRHSHVHRTSIRLQGLSMKDFDEQLFWATIPELKPEAQRTRSFGG